MTCCLPVCVQLAVGLYVLLYTTGPITILDLECLNCLFSRIRVATSTSVGPTVETTSSIVLSTVAAALPTNLLTCEMWAKLRLESV